MRVIHVTPYFPPAFHFGGPPRSILALCQAQRAAGLEVEVFTTTVNGAGSRAVSASRTSYEGTAVRYFAVRGPSMFFWAPRLCSELADVAQDADVIHSHGLFNAPTWQAHRTARHRRRPLVVSVRGMLEPSARAHHALRKRAAWSLFDRRVCADAALLHTTSTSETANVRAAAPHARIAQIPNAVDVSAAEVTTADRRAVRPRIGLDDTTRFVLFLGRLHPIKRLDLLAEAFAKIATQFPDVRLVIAGAGDPGVRTRTDAALGEARSKTIWAGEVADRERDALLSEAAALVLCSDSENFGMSVAEALSFGVVPVVTQTCPWEMLAHEKAGFWVPQTAAGIADGLARVLASPDAAREMSKRGPQLAAERFGRAAIGSAWAAQYAQLAR
jgi:glycosyltransferase involved in cell wall biosynthesis